jgi:hypothetical protein
MKKSRARKARAAAKRATAPARKHRTLEQQPQNKQVAAEKAGMFLHTDDAWSAAYFNPDDLHNLERELFG